MSTSNILVSTCSKKGDGFEQCELFGIQMELWERPNVLLDLADGGGHLADPGGGQLLLGHRGLEVTDDRGQHGRQRHRLGALGHPQHENVSPAVSQQGLLSLVPARRKKLQYLHINLLCNTLSVLLPQTHMTFWFFLIDSDINADLSLRQKR